jgi:DNA-binding NtrC family response regulator
MSVALNYDGKIHLLLSDIQMASLSGPELGENLKKQRPELRVMLMSAMKGGSMLVLNYGWAYIEKPFVKEKLLQMIDLVLHSPDKSQGSNQYDTRK